MRTPHGEMHPRYQVKEGNPYLEEVRAAYVDLVSKFPQYPMPGLSKEHKRLELAIAEAVAALEAE